AASRDEQMAGRTTVGATDVTRGLVGNGRSHAVSEKGEWPVEIGLDRGPQRRDHGLHGRDRRLSEPRAATRQLNGVDTDVGRQFVRPIAIALAAATRERQAK